jgi:hypothetical protein
MMCCERLEEDKEVLRQGEGKINVLGCCMHCYQLEDLKYCPYCGTPMAENLGEI